jgi:hypothetical protein
MEMRLCWQGANGVGELAVTMRTPRMTLSRRDFLYSEAPPERYDILDIAFHRRGRTAGAQHRDRHLAAWAWPDLKASATSL